ncbi:MAG: peptidoglycan-binding protein [Clostridia bacterium]|nr:peptidoglycan-binding protein [Clostridia bacterium]
MTPNQNQQEAIRNLQRYLRHLSYFYEEIIEVPIDGIFGTDTEAALRAFQKLENLPPTGRADQVTWERLYETYSRSNDQRRAPNSISYFPRIPENYTVEVGEAQFLVSIIQNALQELAAVYDDIGTVPQTGTYDEETARAVRIFQGVNGLPQTGAVDRATWNAIADAYNRNFSSPYLRH